MDADIDSCSPTPQSLPCCVVCGGTSGRIVAHENGYDAIACSCGGIYLSPVPIDYDPSVENHAASFYAFSAGLKLSWLAKSHFGGKLLEVGCGEGHFLRAAQERGFEIAGIEVDPKRSRRAAKVLGCEIENSSLEESRWPAASCDIVSHIDLLSHFVDPKAALQKMARLLRPAGVLFFEVGLVGGLKPFWYQVIPTLCLPVHRWFFSEAALRRLMESCGLEILRSKRFGLLPSTILLRAAYLTRIRKPRQPGEPPRAEELPEGMAAVVARVACFARYRLGTWLPGVGEGTILVVARPRAQP